MFDFFVGFFSDPFNIVMAALFVAAGILFGVLIVRYLLPRRNKILYCRERDGRGLELNVDSEDAVCLETSSSPEMRFFKYGRSYEFPGRMGRTFTRFLAKEGTAYTWRLQGFGGTKEKPKQVELNGSLEDFVKYRWGDKYDVVPEEMKTLLRDDKVLLTVNLEPGIVPEGYMPITESVIKKKANEDMAQLMAKSLKGAVQKGITDWLPYVFMGAGILAIASKLLGWW